LFVEVSSFFFPLSSPWALYFQNKELERSIQQDINRTHPDSEFFQQEWVRQAMLRCLFLFAKENGETSYRQGMHELLSVIMYLLDREKFTTDQLKKGSLSGSTMACELLDTKHLEADAFILFSQLMQHANPWFEVADTRAGVVQKDGVFIADRKQAEESAVSQSPIVTKSRMIQ
jgi:TBC1 domain family protein 5